MKKVIIWGAEGGIGRAVLDKFKKEGWQAVGLARQINTTGNQSDWSIEADFTQWDEVDQAAEKIADQIDAADVLVFAAGDIASEKVAVASPERWVEVLNNNLTGLFYALRASLPMLKEDGHIFLLGAVSERLQLPGLSAYAAAKAGLEAFVVSLAKEERRKKISLVRPGAVATALWDKVPFNQPDHAYQPEQIAEKIWEAYQQGHKGKLDLV